MKSHPAKSPRKAQPQRKAKKLGRPMWADRNYMTDRYGRCDFAVREEKGSDIFVVPLLVFRQADREKVVEVAAQALHQYLQDYTVATFGISGCRAQMNAVFTALNWHPLPDKEGKK